MNQATLFGPTPVAPTGVRLRNYQLDAISRINARFDAGDRSTLLVLPTGTGKTVTFGSLARSWARDRGVRTLVLAHRGELIQQAADALSNLGLAVGVEQASSRARSAGEPHAVIATVQTMQGRRLETWPRDYFGLVVTDEAHHATADTYGRVYDHFAGVPHLGVTATADRGDKVNLGAVFDSVAFEYTLLDAMTAPEPGPYLSRLTVVQCDLPIDLSAIRTTAGDLNAADLEEALRPHVEPIATAIKRETAGRSTLVFTPDVGSAMAIATALGSIGVSAAWVSGDDPDRARKVADYKAGDVRVLCNCSLLTEGFDAPRTAAVVLCRPTKSRALFAQMVGRGTRLAPGKTDCLIVDFEWICGRHRLVKPVELIASRLTQEEGEEDEVREEAARLMESGEEPDLLEAIERAKANVEEKARRRLLAVAARERSDPYRKITYDPFAGYHAIGLPSHFPPEARPIPATEKQVAALKRMGIAGAESFSRRRASAMLDVLCGRIEKGLASKKQVDLLIARGFNPAECASMSFEAASAHIERLIGARRRPA